MLIFFLVLACLALSAVGTGLWPAFVEIGMDSENASTETDRRMGVRLGNMRVPGMQPGGMN